jgi:hypothetical protein
MKIARFGLTAMAVVAAVAITVGVLRHARAAVVFNGDVPLLPSIVNPCNGETVDISGAAHEVVDETLTPSGNVHLSMHINAQGVSGIGEITGAKYSISNSINEELNFAVGQTQTFNNTFRIIGQGGAPNFNLHFQQHITVNANGTVTSFIDNFSATCN